MEQKLTVLARAAGDGAGLDRGIYGKFSACVHCGFCLQACPTYLETQNEADSPRGRIHLMKALADGRIGATEAVFEHLDRCLVCRGCETACPSGVEYHAIIEAMRPLVAEKYLGRGKRMRSGMLHWGIGHVLPYPKRFGRAIWAAGILRKIGLGAVLERMAPGMGALIAAVHEDAGVLAGRRRAGMRFIPAGKPVRGEVLLLGGCVGSVVSEDINAACVKVLVACGFGVQMLSWGEEPCCGALAAHGNDPETAKRLAENLIERAERVKADFIISGIAGCGAQLTARGEVLAGGAMEERGRRVAGKVRDICEFVAEQGGPEFAAGMRMEKRVCYHDACHLAHGQKITAAPRKLLAAIPGLTVVPLVEGDICCGAAGTYSLNQPELAGRLGRRKAERILKTGAAEVVMGNIGCILQIRRHLAEMGEGIPVRHVVQLLAEACGESVAIERDDE